MAGRIAERRKGGGRLEDVKGTEINYITRQNMFNAVEALDKYGLDIGWGRSQWPRGLRRGSAAERLLGS
jgi:hypothetical protein